MRNYANFEGRTKKLTKKPKQISFLVHKKAVKTER